MNNKAYRVYNKRTLTIEESIHVAFDEVDSLKPKNIDDDNDDDINVIENNVNNIKLRDQISQDSNKEESMKNASHLEQDQQFPESWRIVKNHPIDQILGDPSQGVITRSSLRNVCNNMAFVSDIEPKNIEEAETDEFWLMAMEEELNQFERNNVWTLVPRPTHQSIIGTKWIFRNKKDENGIIIRNKARLVAQGFNHEEGIDYEETFALIARLEAIRMLLAFACYKDFKLFQMDVKSAFLNGLISEEVYVEQPPGFESHEFPNHVFKLTKALYGLKQAPRAWYERLSGFLLEKSFTRGKIDTTLFTETKNDDLLIVQIYVDDIIFGSTNKNMCSEFSNLCKKNLK